MLVMIKIIFTLLDPVHWDKVLTELDWASQV